jgi:hypothetical protein
MTAHDHSEGIRLQAERVVRAHKELCAAAKSAGDDFPTDKLGELFQQVRALDGWLQPTETDTRADAWTIGSDLAVALLEDAGNVGEAALLEPQYREPSKPQNNIVLGYLNRLDALRACKLIYIKQDGRIVEKPALRVLHGGKS